MVFSSMFFVFFFFPLNLFFYFRASNRKNQNIVMLVFSLIFYAWNAMKYLLLITSMTLISYLAALYIEKFHDDFNKKQAILISAIVGLLGTLAYFKYTVFFFETLDFLLPFQIKIPEIVLPIGISFYTFQLLSYVIDVYRGEVKAQPKYYKLLLYASLFHQCIAGPIVRYQDVAEDIDHRVVKASEIKQGIKRFCVGLGKKVLLANNLALIADSNLLTENLEALKNVPALGLWLGILAFAFQIYFDFSAYSDMAIGMGLMIGFHYKENFNYPYMSNSVSDFWRRWHISLGSFFRDYVYIPLGGNRSGNLTMNLFIVWFLTGMWHGASWNYILWGLYFFLILLFERKFFQAKLEKLPHAIGVTYSFMVVLFGWVLFKFENLNFLFRAILGLFALNGNGFIDGQIVLVVKNNIFLLLFAALASTNLLKKINQHLEVSLNRNIQFRKVIYIYDAFMPWVLLILSGVAMIGNSYNPFLYFQF